MRMNQKPFLPCSFLTLPYVVLYNINVYNEGKEREEAFLLLHTCAPASNLM